MDEIEVIKIALNNTIARSAKLVQQYEIEVANLTAEIIRLQSEVESLKNNKTAVKEK